MHVIIRRKLKDYDSWKKAVSELDGLRKQYGSRGATVYRNTADPNEVFLVFDWDEAKPYTDYLQLPDVKRSLEASGTTEVFEIRESFHLAE
jgi:quinol monooxygenase YgiN